MNRLRRWLKGEIHRWRLVGVAVTLPDGKAGIVISDVYGATDEQVRQQLAGQIDGRPVLVPDGTVRPAEWGWVPR